MARRRSIRKIIADGVRRERLKREWGQQELAVKAGLHLRHVQKIEAAEVGITVDTLELIARAFGCSVVDLFADP